MIGNGWKGGSASFAPGKHLAAVQLPQDTVPDLPGPLRGALPPVTRGHLLEPDRQSLRQIAWYSHRDPSEAVSVCTESIRAYRQAHPPPLAGPAGRPPAPLAPPAPPAAVPGGGGGS